MLQEQAQPEKIAQLALELLTRPERQAQLQADYVAMRAALGEPGVLARAAKAILEVLDGEAGSKQDPFRR